MPRSAILLVWMLPLLQLTSCTQDEQPSVQQGNSSTNGIQWGAVVDGVRLGISCDQWIVPRDRAQPLSLHVQNVGNQSILFPELSKLADRQFCIMLEVSVAGRGRAWGSPAIPGPVGPDVFIEIPPGEVVSVTREFFASSKWFRRGETARLGFQINSVSFSQAASAKQAEGIAVRIWTGHVHSGSVSLRFD